MKICLDEDTQRSRGFGYVTYVFPEHALGALTEVDGSCFQGRLIRVHGAKEEPKKDPPGTEENGESQNTASGTKKQGGGTTTEYKKKKKEQLKNQNAAQQEQTWNLLYVSANAATDAMAKKLGMDKRELLNREDSSLAVTVALGETQIIQETKQQFCY